MALDQIDGNLASQKKTITRAERIKVTRQKESLKEFNEKKDIAEETLNKLNGRIERRKSRLDLFDSTFRQKGEDLTNQDASLKQMEKELGNMDHLILEDNLFKDIFYLTGYILEAFTVYLVYKNGGFPPEKDIKCLDVEFSQKTHVDYYKTIRFKESVRHGNDTNSEYTKKSVRHEYDTNNEDAQKLKELNELIKNTEYFYSIEGHDFSRIIAFVLRNPQNDVILPSNSIPIFSKKENKQIENMIRKWGTKLRYSSEDCCEIWDEDCLNPRILKQLLDLCESIKDDPCCKL